MTSRSIWVANTRWPVLTVVGHSPFWQVTGTAADLLMIISCARGRVSHLFIDRTRSA